MNKQIWILIFLAVIIVVLLGFFIFMPSKPEWKEGPLIKTGFFVSTLVANSEVSSPLKITGDVNGDGWVGFEGQVGSVRIEQRLSKTINVLASAPLTATTEWTSLPTSFEAILSFTPTMPAQELYLVFSNENPSGDPAKDKTFTLPVKLVSAGETMTVKVYFDSSTDFTCTASYPANRQIPKTEAVARAALEELLKGPTQQEINQGFKTVINPGVKIQSLVIDAVGTARVDFSKELEVSGGSCLVSAIRAQITKTLEQFSTIKNVIISINGETETILQP